jgi:hypothetical protein
MKSTRPSSACRHVVLFNQEQANWSSCNRFCAPEISTTLPYASSNSVTGLDEDLSPVVDVATVVVEAGSIAGVSSPLESRRSSGRWGASDRP